MRLPSGLYDAPMTASSCPRRTVSSLPVAASQMRAVLSSDVVTIRLPSGLYTALITKPADPPMIAIRLDDMSAVTSARTARAAENPTIGESAPASPAIA